MSIARRVAGATRAEPTALTSMVSNGAESEFGPVNSIRNKTTPGVIALAAANSAPPLGRPSTVQIRAAPPTFARNSVEGCPPKLARIQRAKVDVMLSVTELRLASHLAPSGEECPPARKASGGGRDHEGFAQPVAKPTRHAREARLP